VLIVTPHTGEKDGSKTVINTAKGRDRDCWAETKEYGASCGNTFTSGAPVFNLDR
jgi:hypothetical protein